MNLYVGNLAYDTTEEDLAEAFGQFGTVTNVSILQDRITGRSRGFGFVEMSDSSEGQAAIDGMNDQEFQGRKLKVNQARPKPEGSERRGRDEY